MNAVSKKDRGTVLLTTMLIMTVMAAITIALMDDIKLSVKRTLNVQAYAQADWQADGAEEFVAAYLKNDFAALAPEAQAVLLQSQTPLVLPTPGGAITLTLKDASQCFNLNAVLSEAGGPQSGPVGEFVRMSELLGLPKNQAIALSNMLLDWQDADQIQRPSGAEDGTYLRKIPPYRTADTHLRSPEELRALHGMDEDLWELYRPFVCTGGAGVMPAVNINAISAERIIILAAALSGDNAVSTAEALIRDRPLIGYRSQSEVDAVLERNGLETWDPDRIGLKITSVFVEAVTEVGPAERVRTYRFDGLDEEPRLTYRGWGRESFRPEIETQTESDSETEVDAR